MENVQTMEMPSMTDQSEAERLTEQLQNEMQGLRDEILQLQRALEEQQLKQRQTEVNLRNALRSTGAITNAADSGYYSPDEVRKMSASEVRQKYGLIKESMKKWN